MGTRTALVIAWAAAAGAAGCSRGGRESRVEAELKRAVGDAIGEPVKRVECRGARCTATVADQPVPIAVHDEAGELAWEVDGWIVDGRALAAEVESLLDELGLGGRVDCGPAHRVVRAGDQPACQLADLHRDGAVVYATGAAFATIAADGTAAVELALGQAALDARVRATAEADLDALSRALDRDDPAGEADDDDEAVAPADAAVATSAAPVDAP